MSATGGEFGGEAGGNPGDGLALKAEHEAPLDVDAVTKANQRLDFKTWVSIMRRAFHLIGYLFSVYFLEYMCITSFADVMGQKMKLIHHDRADDFDVRAYFDILNACYQLGVFLSRSSLRFFRIKHVWVLSVLQAINFTFCFLNARYMFCPSLGLMAPLLVWVGLMGGGSYVNVLVSMLELKTLEHAERESAMSLSLFFNDFGITLASLLSLVLAATLFSDQ